MSEYRLSAAELQRRGERVETVRELLHALADRVYALSRDQEQDADVILLHRARAFGWVPWHDRQERAVVERLQEGWQAREGRG